MTPNRTGARILVDQLRLHGVDTAFGVPGESYLAVLDALHDVPDIRFIVCRQEVGAAHMAEAYGKLTGRPGICFVTRGPGATHASAGCHVARQDSTPLILFIGQARREFLEREAFQEIDYRKMFAPLAKWVVEIGDPARIPELVARAFHTATSGRPGPVVVSLPEDMLGDFADVPDVQPYQPTQAAPNAGDMARVEQLLADARRPLLLVGGGTWSAEAAEAVDAFVRRTAMPVCTSFRCQDYIDNDNPYYAGHVGIGVDERLAAHIGAADVLLIMGARLGEATTGGYNLVQSPVPHQTLIHVYPEPEEIGRVYQPKLGIVAGMTGFARALRELSLDGRRWEKWAHTARADYEASLVSEPVAHAPDLAAIVRSLRERLPPDAIVTNGAGNYTAWVHRFFRYRSFRTQLAPTNGAMGYGVPAAVAAKAVYPRRHVVFFNGDGCFLMCGNELATAVQYGLAPVFVIVNNGMYGTIRMHQEKHYPGRVYGTDLVNPDFVALGRSYGAYAERVKCTEDFLPAFDRAVTSGKAAVIEVRTDPDLITPRTTIGGLRANATGRVD